MRGWTRETFGVRLLSFCCFHFQTQTKHLAPGKYDLGSFTKDLNGECWTMNIIIMLGRHYSGMLVVPADCHRKKHGRFGTVPQHPVQSTERIYCSTLSQCPRRKVQAVSSTILQASSCKGFHTCVRTHTHMCTPPHTHTQIHRRTLVLVAMSYVLSAPRVLPAASPSIPQPRHKPSSMEAL